MLNGAARFEQPGRRRYRATFLETNARGRWLREMSLTDSVLLLFVCCLVLIPLLGWLMSRD